MLLLIFPALLIAIFLVMGVIWFTPELRANFFLWQGKNRKARKIYESLLEQYPDRAHLYQKLARIYYMENRRDRKALRVFEVIVKLRIPFPWQDEILTEVAKYYIILGRKDSEAIRTIEKAVDNELQRLKAAA